MFHLRFVTSVVVWSLRVAEGFRGNTGLQVLLCGFAVMRALAGGSFNAHLGAVEGWDGWEGMPAQTYEFKIIENVQSNDDLVDACAEHGMKPVCDSWATCGPWVDDSKGLFLGNRMISTAPGPYDPNVNRSLHAACLCSRSVYLYL